jgi:hypothetical protein
MTSDGAASSLVHLQRPIRWGATGVTSPEHAFSLPVGTVTFLLSDVAEIVTLSDLVNRERLVTATGSGGAGRPVWRNRSGPNCSTRSRPVCGGWR